MANFSLSQTSPYTGDQDALFKINYYKKSENMYNSANVLQGRIRKRYDFTGRQRFVATPLSFSGGVGSGSLPTGNAGNYEGAIIESKRVYAVCEIEREAMKASANDAGAFVRATAETVKKTVESYMRNASRILWGDGSAALGTLSANATGTAAAPVCVISAATWKEANFEEKDYVNVDSGTDLFEVVSVVPSTRTVTLSRLSGTVDLTATGSGSVLYMQGSKDNDPLGLKKVKDISIAGSGDLYGIAYERRWSMALNDASSKGITVDMMNGIMLDVEKRFGQVPDMIVTSYAQFQNILALLEDQKVYNLPNTNLKGHMGFKGVEFMSTRGPIGIFVDRFCEDDEVWFLNSKYIEVHHRPGFGWFDDDGTVFLREASSDAYSARYGGYYQNFITPTAHGVIHSLAI